jgi:hypothetical protein
MKHVRWIAPALLAFAVAGCGGGSSPAPLASDAVPDSASQGDGGLVAWVLALTREDTETKEPLDLSNFAPAAAEDTEPQPLQ